jgi:hypothetical protein
MQAKKERNIASSVYDKDYLMSNHLSGFSEFQAGGISALKEAQIEKLRLEQEQLPSRVRLWER